MMKKRYLGIVCLITACALLCCGCGDKGTAILIGEMKESADVPAEGEQEVSRASGQAGTAAQSAASGENASNLSRSENLKSFEHFHSEVMMMIIY